MCACIKPFGYELNERTLSYYVIELTRAFAETSAVECEGYVVLVANLSNYGNDPDIFFGQLSVLQRDANLRIGSSPVFDDLTQVRGRFVQAREALDIALAYRPHQWRNSFDDMRLSFLYKEATRQLDPQLLMAREIDMLADHDRENGTSYVDTLETYLECGLNALMASKRLFIHRTTMAYRLGRIQEIAGIDFDDFDQVLYLMFSLRVLAKHLSEK